MTRDVGTGAEESREYRRPPGDEQLDEKEGAYSNFHDKCHIYNYIEAHKKLDNDGLKL
jgi:hypothetical protein